MVRDISILLQAINAKISRYEERAESMALIVLRFGLVFKSGLTMRMILKIWNTWVLHTGGKASEKRDFHSACRQEKS